MFTWCNISHVVLCMFLVFKYEWMCFQPCWIGLNWTYQNINKQASQLIGRKSKEHKYIVLLFMFHVKNTRKFLSKQTFTCLFWYQNVFCNTKKIQPLIYLICCMIFLSSVCPNVETPSNCFWTQCTITNKKMIVFAIFYRFPRRMVSISNRIQYCWNLVILCSNQIYFSIRNNKADWTW